MKKVTSLQKQSYPAPDVKTAMVPAPTDGWDAISPIALMDPKRAPILDNWIPRTGFVEVRSGYSTYKANVNGSSTPVESLMVLRTPLLEKFIAATGNSVVDITNAASPVNLINVTANNRWQSVNYRPAGGTAVIQMCNGADALRQYDGTTLSTPSITGLPVGITTNNFINVYSIKRRLWYLALNSQIAFYLPVDAVSGAIAGSQDCGPLFTRGGFLTAVASWTSDGGSGPNEYTAFISNRGQVAVFYGVDPTSANTWQLVGIFNISPPIGRRCLLNVGADVAIITLQGILPLSQSLPFDPSADRSVAITQRIQNAMQSAAQNSQFAFGWELSSYPNQALAILNVPIAENSVQYQYVMNVLSGAWCRFTGWNANTFAIFNDNLYFGDNTGNVRQAFNTGIDGATPINLDMQCAYNYFEDPGRTKRMTMIQPLLVVGGLASPTLLVDADFAGDDVAAPLTSLQGTVVWDEARWDVAVWPQPSAAQTDWYSVEALGHALAIRMKLTLTATGSDTVLQVNAFNVILEMGGYV